MSKVVLITGASSGSGKAAAEFLSLPLFGALMAACELSPEELYRHYVGKNVLNFFRQDHGYQDGTYVKEWHGREDNEHLSELLDTLSPSAADFPDQVYEALSVRYRDVQWAPSQIIFFKQQMG